MTMLTNNTNYILEKASMPYVEKGMNILNKYTELFNSARHFCEPNFKILENNYIQLPIKEVEVESPSLTSRRKKYEYFYNLTILFSIVYKQDVGNSATFKWIDGNDYYGGIDSCFREAFGESYNGFSYPEFITENNCYMANHSQTFKMSTKIKIEKELTKEEVINIIQLLTN